MEHYKYLVMQTDFDSKHSMFLIANLSGGGRCADPATNITHFNDEGRVYGSENDDYWHTPQTLLVGFANWYCRKYEREAYHQHNRVYHATNTYRFFRVLDASNEIEMDAANLDLASYEIDEETFISDIQSSWAFQQVNGMFSVKPSPRPEQNGVRVTIVYNEEHDTWAWVSDYLSKADYELFPHQEITLPNNTTPPDATRYISELYRCQYRFGGNDAYYKRKDLENK